jgi:hypothetical protein
MAGKSAKRLAPGKLLPLYPLAHGPSERRVELDLFLDDDAAARRWLTRSVRVAPVLFLCLFRSKPLPANVADMCHCYMVGLAGACFSRERLQSAALKYDLEQTCSILEYRGILI